MALYNHPPTTFKELIDPLPAEIKNIASRLQKNVMNTLPDVDENVSGDKKNGYGIIQL